MAVSDDFREQLKAGKFGDAFILALSEAVELDITTWVASADSEAKSPDSGQPIPGYRMRTRINIVEGEIENEVGSQFIGNGPYTELRQFHQEQVQEGRQIIQNNLASLQQLFTVLANLSQMPPARRRPESNQALSPSDRSHLS